MRTTLPFRLENERLYLRRIHPLIRLIIPFILVIPFLVLEDFYLTITILFITLIIDLLLRVNFITIFSRLKIVIPFVFLITIFIPFYVGETVYYRFPIGITIYQEGLNLAFLLSLRIFGALYIFMSFFSTLTYSEFIGALTKLRIPSVLIGSLIIMLHYIPILASSNKKILEAQEMRGKKISTYWQNLKTHAYILGKSIVMNMERSEKLYESLKMRGFSGKISFAPIKLKASDIGILILFILIIVNFIFVINLELIYRGVFTLIMP